MLLEWLGFVPPPSGRREPVALPAWTRWLLPIAVVALTLVTMAILVVARAWLV